MSKVYLVCTDRYEEDYVPVIQSILSSREAAITMAEKFRCARGDYQTTGDAWVVEREVDDLAGSHKVIRTFKGTPEAA